MVSTAIQPCALVAVNTNTYWPNPGGVYVKLLSATVVSPSVHKNSVAPLDTANNTTESPSHKVGESIADIVGKE